MCLIFRLTRQFSCCLEEKNSELDRYLDLHLDQYPGLAFSLALKSCFPLNPRPSLPWRPHHSRCFLCPCSDNTTACLPDCRLFFLLLPPPSTGEITTHSSQCSCSAVSYRPFWVLGTQPRTDTVLALRELRGKLRGSKKGLIHSKV